jgi:hypothetical protein
MKPLNRAERNNAFLGFLLFFLLTIGVIITVIFFSIEVPIKETEQLRNDVSTLESEKQLSNAFADAMKEAVDELNKFDVKDEKRELTDAINQNVEFKIKKMNQLISDMPKNDTSVYALVIQSLRDLNEAKTKLRKFEDDKRYAQQ